MRWGKSFRWPGVSLGGKVRSVTFLTIATMVAGSLWAGANVAMETVRSSWHDRQLSELADNVIHRAEFAIDNVILAKVDLLTAGLIECNPESLAAVRDAIYQHGALVDIEIRSPGGHCQAFEGIGSDGATIAESKMHSIGALNADFRFMQLSEGSQLGLGVVWSVRDDHYLTAVIRTDSLLFDMLPAAIRDGTRINLSLTDGSVFARFPSALPVGGSIGGAEERHYVASSARFPIQVDLAIPQTLFMTWGETPSAVVQFAIALASLLVGLLAARGIVRPPSEREVFQAALRDGEIVPFFQPIVCLTAGSVIGCEVLARWIKPDGTHVSPGVFIPLAEVAGQSDDLTRALMRQTGQALGPVMAKHDAFKLNFNVTATQLAKPRFTEGFLTFASRCGLSPKQLVVELIERETVDSMADTKGTLNELQAHGVRVAIDDIGTGQNGLALLQGLGADIVKIDKLFIDMVDADSRSRMICEMLVKVAEDSNMTIVAEGIERRAQVKALRELGIGEAQGFYFARPMPARDFLKLLDADDLSSWEVDAEPVEPQAADQSEQAQKAA